MALTTNFANHEAERALLGTMLQYSADCDKAFSALEVRDFDDMQNRAVYRVLQEMRMRNEVIDTLTVMQKHPELDVVYLSDLIVQALPTTVQIPAYVKILKEQTARRDFLALGHGIIKDVGDVDFDADGMIEKVRLCLKNMSRVSNEGTSIKDEMLNLYDAIFDNPDRGTGIQLKIPGLDTRTNGLKPGRLYVVGARPSVGKTVFGINAALKCALSGKSVLYINREMEKVDMLKRMMSNLSGVSMSALESSSVRGDDCDKVTDALTELSSLPIHISNRARTPAEIRAKAVEIQESEGLGLVVVDYLQRMSSGGRYKSRDEEIGAISMAIKDIAMDLSVPVILLSQLNRTASNTRPNMAMLRESGNIEQDADVIILLHAPDASDVPPGRHDDFRNIKARFGKYLEMIVDKNRHGNTGIVPVGFFGEYMRYVPLQEKQ